MADVEVDVCLRAVRSVKDQDLVKAITKVPQNIRRCLQLLIPEERDGIENFVCSKDALLVFPTEFEKSYLVQFKFLTLLNYVLNAPDVRVPDDPGTE